MNIEKFNLCNKSNTHSIIFSLAVAIIFLFAIFLVVSNTFQVNASTSNGFIDGVYRYAKGVDNKNIKIDFKFFKGSNRVIITDSLLYGYAWGEGIGWVNLYPSGEGVTNNGEGILGGNADSELGGKIDFSGVTINSSGEFTGYATSEKLGRISFNCANDSSCLVDNYKVVTDWRPTSVRGTLPITDDSYVVNVSVGAHGDVDPPSGTVFPSGTNAVFTVTPDNGYKIDTMTADGQPVSNLSKYIFSNINSDHTLSVTFSALPDTSKPSLHMIGSSTVKIYVGDIYTDQGVTADDRYLGVTIDLTDQVQVKNNVDIKKAGTYGVDYSVSDAAGNIAKISRTVIVMPNPIGEKIPSSPVVQIQNGEKNTKNIAEFVKATQEFTKEAEVITHSQVGDISTKTVTTFGVAGGGTALISSFTSSLASFSEFFLAFFRVWSLFLSALGLKKKKQPWGTVYDSVTKQPLDPAYVILYDSVGNEVATSITDLDGRYGFLVSPGTYKMVAKKTNYIAPSLHLYGKERDELYDNLYFGEEIVLSSERAIARNIPMDPQGFDWNEFAKKDKNIMKFHKPRKKLIAQISNGLFIAGIILSIALFLLKPDIYNIGILVVYAIMISLRLFKFRPKSFGTIKDKLSSFPLSFAIVRIYSKATGKEMFHRVADQYGHYYCLLANGDYYLTIEKKNSDESYSLVYTSDVITVRKGIINQDFNV